MLGLEQCMVLPHCVGDYPGCYWIIVQANVSDSVLLFIGSDYIPGTPAQTRYP